MRRSSQNAYTIVEMLIVIFIIGLLASLATPLYMRHTRQAKGMEAVATMSIIRQELRDYRISHNTFFDVAQLASTGNIQKALPSSVDTGTGTPSPNPSGVEVDAGVAQYFSNSAYSVDSVNHSSARFTSPGPVDFVIRVDGSKSVACSSGSTNCALKNTSVDDYRLEMDNTGRIFISFDGGSNWRAW